jgi:hypothetical protein
MGMPKAHPQIKTALIAVFVLSLVLFIDRMVTNCLPDLGEKIIT